MSNRVITIVKEHPTGSAIGAIVLVLIFMFLFKGSSGGGSSSGIAAYYNAMAAQTAAGNAVQLEKMQLDAQTNQETIAAQYGLEGEQLKSADTRYQIDSNERLVSAQTVANTGLQWHAIDQSVSLSNAGLNAQEQIANIQANAQVRTAKAQKPSWFQSLMGAVGQVGSAFALGGLGI